MTSRTENATHASFLEYQETKPTAWKYYPARVAVALIGEGVLRATGWADTVSFKKLEGVTSWLPSWFPGANAQDVGANTETLVNEGTKAAAANAGKEAFKETVKAGADTVDAAGKEAVKASWAWCDYLPCNPWNTATGAVIAGWNAVSKYATDNKGWIGLVAGFAATAAAVNHLSSGKIKNTWARNALSLAIGGAVVWTVSNYVVGHQVGLNAVSDIGLRIVVSHAFLQHIGAPALQTTISYIHYAMNALRWDFSYTAPKIHKSKS